MILRRFMKHVEAQNWFAVGLDVLVVIFGVYIGIYLGEISNEHAVQRDVRNVLQVVHAQLEEDLKAIDTIITNRQDKLKEPESLLLMLQQGDIDMARFGEDLSTAFQRLRTFFPKSSGYAALKDRGYLARLDDPRLIEALAHLYDQGYVRHTVIADENDQNTFFYNRNVIAVYWNLADPGFIGDDAIARARVRNALVRLVSYSDWYVEYLSETLRPAITDTIEAIETYGALPGDPLATD